MPRVYRFMHTLNVQVPDCDRVKVLIIYEAVLQVPRMYMYVR
jgi:hypothetical protein